MERIVWVEDEFYDVALNASRARAMAKALRAHGMEVVAVCSYERSINEMPEFLRVHWLPPCGPGPARRLMFGVQAWARVLAEARKHGVDYVIVSTRSVACAFPLDLIGRLRLGRTKVILDLRTLQFGTGLKARRKREALIRILTRLALLYNSHVQSGLTVINEHLQSVVGRSVKHPEIGIWGSGWFPSDLPTHRIDFLDELTNGRFVLMYHGSLEKNRGLTVGIEAVDIARRCNRDILLLLMGRGPAWTELSHEIAERELERHCVLIDAVPTDEVLSVLRYAHAGFLPYPDSEYWRYNHPIKIVEYLGAGLPVVAGHCRGLMEAFPGCRAITYAREGGAEALAEVILQASADREDLLELGAAGHRYALDLTWEKQAGRLASYLRNL